MVQWPGSKRSAALRSLTSSTPLKTKFSMQPIDSLLILTTIHFRCRMNTQDTRTNTTQTTNTPVTTTNNTKNEMVMWLKDNTVWSNPTVPFALQTTSPTGTPVSTLPSPRMENSIYIKPNKTIFFLYSIYKVIN